jgi:hypothetical protein
MFLPTKATQQRDSDASRQASQTIERQHCSNDRGSPRSSTKSSNNREPVLILRSQRLERQRGSINVFTDKLQKQSSSVRSRQEAKAKGEL